MLLQSQEFYREFFSTDQGLSYDTRERYETVFSLIESLALPSSARVLDIGSGRGKIARFLTERFRSVCSVDIVLTNLMRLTLRNHPQLQFAITALPRLPFADNSFDLVVFSEVLEHLELTDQQPAISEIARVIAPDGFVVMSTPNPDSFCEIARRIASQITFRRIRLGSQQLIENHVSPGRLRGMLRSEFSIEAQAGSFYLIPPMRLMVKVPGLFKLSSFIRERGGFLIEDCISTMCYEREV